MKPEDIGGSWVGSIAGTNSGQIQLLFTVLPKAVICELVLSDTTFGSAALVGAASFEGEAIEVTLAPRDPADAARFGTVAVRATLDSTTRLNGTWKTTAGTSGTLEARRGVLSANSSGALQAVLAVQSATEKRMRVPSCIVDMETIRRIHVALSNGAEEAARIHYVKQTAPQHIPIEILNDHYRVAIIVKGAEGELILSADPQILASDVLPKPLRSVEFDTAFYYRAANAQDSPPNHASVKIDFSRPSAFDTSNPSGSPTLNASEIAAYGVEPTWVAGMFERSRAILQQGAVSTGWLHGAHIYDVLFYALGFPLALGAGVLAASRLPAPMTIDKGPFMFATFLFASLTALWIFRFAFSLSRWLLPYIEFASAPEPLYRRVRLVAATLVVGAVASLAAAVIWGLFR